MNDSYYTPPQVPPQEPKKPANVVEIVALVLGILVCVGLIIRMLFFQPQPVFHSGAQLVKEAVCRALA